MAPRGSPSKTTRLGDFKRTDGKSSTLTMVRLYIVLFATNCFPGDTDFGGILRAVEQARDCGKPAIVITKTTIGYGSLIQGTEKAHGSPLSDDDVAQLKRRWGFPQEQFVIPSEVKQHYEHLRPRWTEMHSNWTRLLDQYRQFFPDQVFVVSPSFERTPV